MNAENGLPRITDANMDDILAADQAVLILTKHGCGHCEKYEREILALRERGELAGLTVGMMVLSTLGSATFKRSNPWVAALQALPYTVVYLKGKRVDAFAASKAGYLLERLRDATRERRST